MIVKTKDNKSEESCPECGNRVITNSFEIICKGCGLVLGNIYQDSSYIFNDVNKKNNLNKQYVALGERIDYIGGLGSFMDYENSKYLRDKTGKLLPPDEQKLYRRLKKKY
ncbi:unnamed protein product, partial [marine sediment metagenome]